MTIVDIWRNKYLDLPPLWQRNACSIKKQISPRPTDAILKFVIKKIGFYDWFGNKQTFDSLDGFWVSVVVNGDTVIEIRPTITTFETKEYTGILSVLNSPYEDKFEVYFGVTGGYPQVRHYIIFDLWLEATFPEGEEVTVKTVTEIGGSGESYDNIVILILQVIRCLPEILLMITLMRIIFKLL